MFTAKEFVIKNRRLLGKVCLCRFRIIILNRKYIISFSMDYYQGMFYYIFLDEKKKTLYYLYCHSVPDQRIFSFWTRLLRNICKIVHFAIKLIDGIFR